MFLMWAFSYIVSIDFKRWIGKTSRVPLLREGNQQKKKKRKISKAMSLRGNFKWLLTVYSSLHIKHLNVVS